MPSFYSLLHKEMFRVWKVGFQTLLAPVLTALLYLLIFSHVLSQHIEVYPGVHYTAFLVPGSVLQNAFANSSSSLIQSKITGNIVFVLLAPIAYWEFFAASVLASMLRGLVVGVGVYVAALWFVQPPLQFPMWIILFAVLGSAMLSSLGVVAGLWAEKFDQLAGFQNFIIMPLTFWSGIFYSIHSLPPFWQMLSRFNPFFYMIDGFRYGFFGVSDISPWTSLMIVSGCMLGITLLSLRLLKSGYKLRH